VKFSSGGQGASLLYSDSGSGLVDQTNLTPCPSHLTKTVGPSASSSRFHTGQELTSDLYIIVTNRSVFVPLLLWGL